MTTNSFKRRCAIRGVAGGNTERCKQCFFLSGEVSMTIETRQGITDEKTVKACQARLLEIAGERISAREAGHIEKLEELEEEEQKIQQFLSTTQNIRGDFRLLGINSEASSTPSSRQSGERSRT